MKQLRMHHQLENRYFHSNEMLFVCLFWLFIGGTNCFVLLCFLFVLENVLFPCWSLREMWQFQLCSLYFLFALVYCVKNNLWSSVLFRKNSSSEHKKENQVNLDLSLEQAAKQSALKQITWTIHLNLQRKIYAFFQWKMMLVMVGICQTTGIFW